MKCSELQREENYNEFLRLSQNEDYVDVTYDEESGGVSAVHKLHKFGRQRGVGGLRRGDYERLATAVLCKEGHRIVLGKETNVPGVKSFDGYLDDIPMEIKAIEGDGVWSICTKLRQADRQGADCIVLYFPFKECYSPNRINEGIRLFHSSGDSDRLRSLSRIMVIVNGTLIADREI